jgi:hypothetical protein
MSGILMNRRNLDADTHPGRTPEMKTDMGLIYPKKGPPEIASHHKKLEEAMGKDSPSQPQKETNFDLKISVSIVGR